jgi:hypothetical protein
MGGVSHLIVLQTDEKIPNQKIVLCWIKKSLNFFLILILDKEQMLQSKNQQGNSTYHKI